MAAFCVVAGTDVSRTANETASIDLHELDRAVYRSMVYSNRDRRRAEVINAARLIHPIAD